MCVSVGFARGHQSEPATAQAAFRAHQVPGQNLQRMAHCHSSAGIPCRAVPTRENLLSAAHLRVLLRVFVLTQSIMAVSMTEALHVVLPDCLRPAAVLTLSF